MYSEHLNCRQPEDEGATIWRYMNFTKLVSLLDTGQIFFSRADRLGDPFEGSWPRQNLQFRQEPPVEIPEEMYDAYRRAMQKMGNVSKAWTTYVTVSCWHMSEHESAAMWNLYLSSREGIAIRSTYQRLKESITIDEPFYVGMVDYLDYDQDVIPTMNLLAPYMHKRKSFEHEREVRALVIKMPDFRQDGPTPEPVVDAGLDVRVNLPNLITSVCIGPGVSRWFVDLTESVVRQYGYEFPVNQSNMDRDPVF